LAQLYQPPYGDRAIVRKDDGQLIGSVGLVPAYGPFDQLPYFVSRSGCEDRRFRPEMGLFWAVDRDFQRQGYASEAAQALVDYAFGQLNLSRIIATTEYSNEGSMGVMKRIGMTIQKNPYPDPVWFQVVGILEQTTT
jgi:RimJ/RimL family protein N-acetyltransferase